MTGRSDLRLWLVGDGDDWRYSVAIVPPTPIKADNLHISKRLRLEPQYRVFRHRAQVARARATHHLCPKSAPTKKPPFGGFSLQRIGRACDGDL